MPSLIDSHCHFDFSVFDGQRATILSRCKAYQIQAIIVPGVCASGWQTLLSICHDEPVLYPALGLHPCFTHKHHIDDLKQLVRLCEQQGVCAIGEIGLDYFIKHTDRSMQHDYFAEQLDIAQQYQLPVLIHARKSHHDIVQQLKQRPSLKGVIHAYSGSYEQAKEYLKMGFKLGFGGAYTYPKATRLRSLLTKLPIEAWVLETDAPDMSPIGHQGETNTPLYLTEIAQAFACLLAYLPESQRDFTQIMTQIEKNTLAIFPFLKLNNSKQSNV